MAVWILAPPTIRESLIWRAVGNIAHFQSTPERFVVAPGL
jgi:hypothetical protein